MYLQAGTLHMLYMAGQRPKYDFGCDVYGADFCENGKCRAPMAALPQDYPFSRTGFYGLRPEEEVKKGEGKRAAVHVSFGAR